ncbi:MAG: hypothetical protein IK097_04305, partial [Clostridia bacterium]|nr:hypothetical protein [Clostridia bacterium]
VGSSKREFEFYTEELKKVKAELQQFRTMVEMLCNGEKKPEDIPEIPVEPDVPDFKAAPAPAVEAPAPVVEAPAPVIEKPVVEIPAEPAAPAAEKGKISMISSVSLTIPMIPIFQQTSTASFPKLPRRLLKLPLP